MLWTADHTSAICCHYLPSFSACTRLDCLVREPQSHKYVNNLAKAVLLECPIRSQTGNLYLQYNILLLCTIYRTTLHFIS